MASLLSPNSTIGVGFGTAGLGGNGYQVTLMALEAGFRKFDTAEADGWYDQKAVGLALRDYFAVADATTINDCEITSSDTETPTCGNPTPKSCLEEELRISTKVAPWSMTSVEEIRARARQSRQELVGFCEDVPLYQHDNNDNSDPSTETYPYPLDVYYIHAPKCWKGWHPRCNNPPPLLNVYDAWMALEAVLALDHSAQRIGLSNVHPKELRSIIGWIQQRKENGDTLARIPDVLQAFADPLQPSEELRRICAQHGIEFVSYSTLGTQHRRSKRNPVLNHMIVQSLAAKHQRSGAEVVLGWALQKNMSVIPRSGNWEHIQELARLLTGEDPTFLHKKDVIAIDSMKQTKY